MMVIYRVGGNTFQIVACPPEDLRKGDYLLIRDQALNRSLIIQVINSEYANVPGLLEDILRESSTENMRGIEFDALKMKSYVDIIKDAQLFTCKVRKAVVDGKLNDDISWTPNRTGSRLMRLDDSDLLSLSEIGCEPAVRLGRTRCGTEVSASILDLDGSLNIIAGKKGSGKSHFSKLLLLGLISQGGVCIVFDVNGEYVSLDRNRNGQKSPYAGRILTLTPGENFKVTLSYAGLGVILSMLSAVTELPASSASELRGIWNQLEETKTMTLAGLEKSISSIRNEYIREALVRRNEVLRSTRFFTDEEGEANTFEEIFRQISQGGAVVLDLSTIIPPFRKIIVEFTLRKLSYLLERWILRGLFLFAEEAHLYLKETHWEDVVTRMRHLGLFATFVTNQPDSIADTVYRQADNIFLFNFTNENDLNTVSRAARVDEETVNTIGRELPPRSCLVLGKVAKELPLIIGVNPLDVKTMGETRFFFTDLLEQRVKN